MTELLYLKDSYISEHGATVVAVDRTKVELDCTIFYPESGGQPSDHGTLTQDIDKTTDYQVLCVKKDDGKIIHEVDKEGLLAGDIVVMRLDWQRRYTFMRYHTASHILSAVINKETNAVISGNQISLEHARDDFSLENFDRAQIAAFEEKTNEIIRKELPIIIAFMPREEAMKIPAVVKLMKGLPEHIQEVRIVDIVGFDRQACGGTHLKNTSEVRGIHVTNVENKGKNNRRIEFVLNE